MRLTGKRLKNGTKLERVTLYHFEKSAEFEVCENDASTGIVDHVNCCICMDEYEEAVFGNEYRSQYLEKRGQQRADLMCFLLSEMNRRLASYVYEIKHSVSGPDRVYDICGQLIGSFREIKGMIAGLGCEGYQKDSHLGVIMTGMDIESIETVIRRNEKEISDLNSVKGRINPIVWKKREHELLPVIEKTDILKLFIDHKINIDDKEYVLEFIDLLQRPDGGYECSVDFG